MKEFFQKYPKTSLVFYSEADALGTEMYMRYRYLKIFLNY